MLGDFIGGPRMQPGGKCRFMHDHLLAEQDRITGDYSPFWQARDYLGRTDRIRASVFAVHGLNDFNVKTKAFAAWWERLKRAGVERKIWLHNGGHGGPGTPDYKRTENRWFDHELFGVRNGIDREPRASVQRADDSYVHEADWPAPGTRRIELELGARSATAPGTLALRGEGSTDQSFTDNGRNLDTDDVLIQAPDAANPNRLAYRTTALPEAVRISGTPWVELAMSIDNATAANLTAVLVDYGPDGSAAMVTRGWLDPQNRRRRRSQRADPAGQGVPLPLGPAARRPRVRGRAPDRAGGRLDRLRLHAAPAAGHAADARSGRQRAGAAGGAQALIDPPIRAGGTRIVSLDMGQVLHTSRLDLVLLEPERRARDHRRGQPQRPSLGVRLPAGVEPAARRADARGGRAQPPVRPVRHLPGRAPRRRPRDRRRRLHGAAGRDRRRPRRLRDHRGRAPPGLRDRGAHGGARMGAHAVRASPACSPTRRARTSPPSGCSSAPACTRSARTAS